MSVAAQQPGGMLPATAITTDPGKLLSAVEGMRAYVADRMRSSPDEIEPALQAIRETVWRRSSIFDPRKGRPEDFVFGITRNVVMKYLSRARPKDQELNTDTLISRIPDPLSTLVERFDTGRWMRFVADAIGEDDWRVILAIAFDSRGPDDRSAMTTRSLRSIRERVALVASTVRAALSAADSGSAPNLNTAVGCIPDIAGLRAVLPHLGSSCDVAAVRLGIHPGTVRARLATIRRLLDIAMLVLRSEAI